MSATRNMFLTRALQKILSERECKKSHLAKLRSACETSLEDVKAEVEKIEAEKGTGTPFVLNADKYFPTFQLALSSESNKIRVIALDCLQKLIAYGHLTGNGPAPDAPDKLLIDVVIESICECFTGDNTDEQVALQILKALLTAVTSPLCEVHDTTLLLAVKTCFQIHLASKQQVNQTTAKATLTQILNVIFQRMESPKTPTESSEQLGAASEIKALAAPQIHVMGEGHSKTHSEAISEAVSEAVSENVSQVGDAEDSEDALARTQEGNEEMVASGTQADETSDATLQVEPSEVVEALLHNIVDTVVSTTKAPGPAPEEADAEAEVKVEAEVEAAAEAEAEAETEAETRAEAEAEAGVEGTVNGITPEPQEGPSLTDIQERATSAMQSVAPGPSLVYRSSLDISSTAERPGEAKPQISSAFVNVYQHDAFLVVRSLCKLSMKDVSDAVLADPKAHELRSKILSLELLLVILQNSGPVMQTHEEFLMCIKQYLCISLSKNGVSTHTHVFELSLAIFLCLLSCFKLHLKAQIEVFFKDIFMLILESSTSSFQHKWMILQALLRICKDSQLLVDLYLNYDCDLNLDNLFSRMIADVSRIAQGRQSNELGGTPQQEAALKQLGLECLVSVLASMSEWMRSTDEINQGQEGTLEAGVVESTSSVGVGLLEVGVSSGGLGSATTTTTSLNTLPVASDNAVDFVEIKRQKETVEQVISTFNEKPKKGVKLAQEKGLIGSSNHDIVNWLRSEDRLSKGTIGEYLGDGDKHVIEIMYEYVDSLNFKGLDFVSALRQFLAGFRLPGEAQKIDRLMEKFAERYCVDNPDYGYFANADTAYVLAFSIIMLTTDLHNDQVKNKMTKEEFIRNNRGINDSKDLPREFLEGIYDEIARNEIKVKDRASGKLPTLSHAVLADEKKRRALYAQQMTQTLEAAQALLANESRAQGTFIVATRTDLVQPMFGIAWTPCLASFSVPMKSSDSLYVQRLCLDGFRHAIRIASQFYMELERDAFVQALTGFTGLLTGTKNLKARNVESFRTLLLVAGSEGNYLQKAWYPVLRCISALENANVSNALKRSNSTFSTDSGVGALDETRDSLSHNARRSSVAMSTAGLDNMTFIGQMSIPSSSYTADRPASSKSSRETSMSAALELQHLDDSEGDKEQSLVVQVDQIFARSAQLNHDAIIDFVTWLCAVSMEELQNGGHPRMYSLTKIVEISYYNMNRIRLEWSRIWAVLGDHFNKVGSHPNQEIAMFAVDSLRQLAMKFLERGELAHFHFQKDFLKPFEYIMGRNRHADMRDMVVRCITQMVQSQARNIRSGWKNVFSVFSLAAADPNEAIVTLAFDTTKTIFTSYRSSFWDTAFVDGINTLVEFVASTDIHAINMEAIEYIKKSAQEVHERQERLGGELDDESAWVKGWFPILFGLHRIMSRCSLDIRTRALTVLFELLKTYGHTFSDQNWADIFRILFRLFDDQKLPESPAERAAWMSTTCNHALFAVVELYTQFLPALMPLVPQFYSVLIWSISQDNEQLARSATQCLQVLVLSNGKRFDTPTWDATVSGIAQMFAASTPSDLVSFDPDLQAQQDADGMPKDQQRQDLDFNSIIIKCVVQLEMIQAVENIVLQETTHTVRERSSDQEAADDQQGMYEYLNNEQMKVLLDCLRESHDFAKAFNANHKLRAALWKAGFMKQLPNLLKQETSSLHASLGVLYRMYADTKRQSDWDDVEHRLFRFANQIMSSFLALQSEKQRDIWAPVLILILSKVVAFSDDRFQRHIGEYYENLSEMTALELKPEVRAILRDVFHRIGSLFYIMSQQQTPRGSTTDFTKAQ